MRYWESVLAASLAGSLVLSAAASAAEPWSVSVPADALAVVAVRNVAELDAGLKALVGPESDVSVAAQLERNLPAGAFDTSGPLLLVLVAGEKNPVPVTILQGKDPAKLEEARITGDRLPAGIVAVRRPTPPIPPGAPEGFRMPAPPPLYVLQLDRWGVVADRIEPLVAFQSAAERLAVGTAAGSRLPDHMVWVHLNPKSLKGTFTGLLQQMQAQMAREAPAGAPPAAVNRVLDWYVSLLDQVASMDLMADLGAERAAGLVEVELVDGSPLVAAARAAKPVTGPPASLPATDSFLVAGWGQGDWVKAMPPLKTLVKPLFDALAQGADEETRKRMDELWATYDQWATVLGPSFAFVFEPAKPGQGMYRVTEVIDLAAPEKYSELMAKWMPLATDMMKGFMGPFGTMPGGPAMKMDMNYEPAAEKIAGVKVDRMTFKVQMQPPPGAPPEAAEQMKKMMDVMYGPEGMVVRMAVVGNLAVITMGDADYMARAIGRARGQVGDFASNAAVADAVQRIPEGAVAQGLLSVPSYGHMMISMMDRMMIEGLPDAIRGRAVLEAPPLPKAPAPAGLTAGGIYLDGRTVRARVDVPASEIRSTMEVQKQFVARMMWILQEHMKWAQEQQRKADPPPAPPPLPPPPPPPPPPPKAPPAAE
jgi:hypothetical protein